jgi:hypothetical protein
MELMIWSIMADLVSTDCRPAAPDATRLPVLH